MPNFTRPTDDGEVTLAYALAGSKSNPAVLLIAPGGMRSAISFWESTPWNPLTALSDEFFVIAMDQRNAGSSTGPVSGQHGWHTYAEDQLALLDHLGVENFQVAGMCIGGPYAFGLVQAAPERVTAAVLFQSIGLDNNREAFYAMFDSWAEQLAATSHSQVSKADWERFRGNLFDGDFLFNLDATFVQNCSTPVQVLMGDDLYHPKSTSLAIAELAPNAEFVERWKEGPDVAQGQQLVLDFLRRHAQART